MDERANGAAVATLSSPGGVLRLIREGRARTRNELMQLTGMSRSTVLQRVGVLLASGLVREVGGAPSAGGRPPTLLTFNEEAGVVAAVDLGARHGRVAVTDLGGRPLATATTDLRIADGPDRILGWVREALLGVLDEAGRTPADVDAIGIGVPGPVEHATGRAVSPPIMPGWDGYPIPDFFAPLFSAPVLVDNDVNIMALGEWWAHLRDCDSVLFVKVSTGIGAGLVAHGEVYRGTQGAAGAIGHIRVAVDSDVRCTCGNTGCLGSLASGSALVRRLREEGADVSTPEDVVGLALHGDAHAKALVRESGRLLGEVLAGAVNLLNPSVIVVGGTLAHAAEPLLAGLREVVYQRGIPLATSRLRIEPTRLGDRAGLLGAAMMAVEHVVDPATVDARLLGGAVAGMPGPLFEAPA